MATQIVLFAIGVGLSLIAGQLLRPKNEKGNLGEDAPTTRPHGGPTSPC